MTIKFTSGAPERTQDMLSSWVTELQNPDPKSRDLARIGDGYEIRYLSAADIAAGRLLGTEQVSRWRHLVTHGAQPLGELELDETGSPVALYKGPGKDGFKAAMEKAAVIDDDFEAVVLTSSALHFVGLWLHNAGSDLIMPYPPNATALENYVPVSPKEAMAVLQPLAASVVEASSGSEPTGG